MVNIIKNSLLHGTKMKIYVCLSPIRSYSFGGSKLRTCINVHLTHSILLHVSIISHKKVGKMGQSTFIIHKGISCNQRISCCLSTSTNNFERRLCQMYYVSMALILPHGASDSFGHKFYCSYAVHRMWLDIASG